MTPIQMLPQQTAPVQRPIFLTNPLNYLINNEYSGTMNINNLVHINRLYEMMKEALIQESNANYSGYNTGGNIFATSNSASNHRPTVIFATTNSQRQAETKPSRLFATVKGKKIFNIVKEPSQTNNRRKSVKIIYKQEEDYSNAHHLNYNFEEQEEEKEEHYDMSKQEGFEDIREEEYVDEEEELKHDEAHDNIFDSSYPNFLNMNMFK